MGNTITIIKNSNTWIEGNAIQQLERTAQMPHIQRVAAMPDLHAGRGYPIGAAFFSVGHFYPALIGNDIGCGMAFWQTDLPVHKIKLPKLVKQLGNIDAPLNDTWAERIAELIPNCTYPQAFSKALGTIGGGNHFAELQAVDKIYLPDLLPENFNPKCLQLLVHSGSRGLGQAILRDHVEKFSHAGLAENTPQALDYLAQHDFALQFAHANRQLIAERMLAKWGADGVRLLDVHHNFLQQIQLDNQTGWLHRKGATPSDCGLVVIPGSRGDYSYWVKPIVDNAANALFSLAHGAGRKWQRSECKGRLSHKYSVDNLRQTHFGSVVVCEDKSLIYEEAPQAYKNIDDVIAAMVDWGLIELVARFKPVLTYKTAGECC
ncbi:MAG: RNA ligase RtcB family protein [Alysiella sp.]|uniref:RNA ligase RtcB family protein n=1 Tax=Alysiella sp. TaxID=1872483 RepID=UPI0026DD761A|nr:RNA ligase RtcB family protein [Alysiella sp.]MDO4434498.1 RNA ligase RtcB family protein [Alysiella sp.]